MRFFLGLLFIVAVAVLTIFLIARGVHRTVNPPPNVNNYNNSQSSVTQTTTGILTGEERRTAIQIVVTQSSRTINILTGYEQTVTNTNSTPNTPTAYKIFLQGLEQAGFTKNRISTQPNLFAVCPLGTTYQYTLDNGGNTVSNLWDTTCSLNGGSFDGLGQTINQLFQLQIPNYLTFTQNVNLST